jgi:hypothetical protein
MSIHGPAPENSSESLIQYGMSISTDRDRFLRRSCASCGRDFKTEIDESELQWALAFQVQRMGLEIGADATAAADLPARMLRCPYCGFEGRDQDMHTEETFNYFKRVILRECALPRLNHFFADLEDTFAGFPRGGLVAVEFRHTPGLKPVRPIHGPEPPDMEIIELLCCGKKLKLPVAAVTKLGACPFCNSEVRLM